MRGNSIVSAAGIALLPMAQAIAGKSYTTWDCCKPACASPDSLGGVRGTPKVCNIDNRPLANGITAQSGCQSGGTAFLCQDYAPTPLSDDLSMGFAIIVGENNSCCKCYKLTWTSGAARNKQMIVQIINKAPVGNLKANDMIILTPGGGAGPNEAGCRTQYGMNWGNSGGGVNNRDSCAGLPQNLQGGCYWRFNWARGDINGWDVNYEPTSCPSRLTDASGCSA